MSRSGVHRPKLRSLTLANGLRVLLAPDPTSPTVSVWVWYRVGSKNEWPGITGASHWVEHMLFEGSPRYAKGEIDRAVLKVGGELNAFTDTDFTAYFTTVPRDHLSVPLNIEADRMTRAAISDEEVARERTVIHSEREGNENWPEFRVEEELFQLAFRVHPYRWDALGRRRDIEQMTAEQLREYYRRFYGPKNAVLVVVGGFDPRTTETEVRRRFSKLPPWGDNVEVPDIEPPAAGERRSTLHGPGTTPYLQVGWRSPALTDPATPATLVLDTILGGESRVFSAGMGWRGRREHPTARLYRALVDKGLAVRATSGWNPRFYPSLFTVGPSRSRGLPRPARAGVGSSDRAAFSRRAHLERNVGGPNPDPAWRGPGVRGGDYHRLPPGLLRHSTFRNPRGRALPLPATGILSRGESPGASDLPDRFARRSPLRAHGGGRRCVRSPAR